MKRLLAVSILFVTVGCENFNLKTRDDLRNVEAAPTKSAEPVTKSEPAPASATPPVVDHSEEANAQMRELNGRVDEVENQAKQTTVAIVAMKDQAAKDKQASDQRLVALEEEIKKQNAQIDALTEQVNKPKPVAPADPQTLIADGDDLFTAKKYKEAIVVFQKYRDGFPKGNRYAEVTFKIGNSFQELGMKDEAKAFYEEVITKFPKSPEAKKAAKRIKSLK